MGRDHAGSWRRPRPRTSSGASTSTRRPRSACRRGSRSRRSWSPCSTRPASRRCSSSRPSASTRSTSGPALERGLHVFSEKPMAHSLESADRIVAMGEAHPGRLVFGHMMRFDPRWNALRRAVADGRLGQARPSLQPRLHPRLRGPCARRPDQPRQRERDPRPGPAPVARRARSSASTARSSRTGVAGEGLVDAAAATLRFAERRDRHARDRLGDALGDRRLVAVADDRRRLRRASRGSTRAIPASGSSRPRRRRRSRRPSSSTIRAAPSRGSTGSRTSSSSRRSATGATWPIDLAAARSALAVALAVERSIEEGRPVTVAEMG